MEEVVFCEGCHRVLSLDYQFCPYCGLERDAPGIPRSLADVIGQIDANTTGSPDGDRSGADDSGEARTSRGDGVAGADATGAETDSDTDDERILLEDDSALVDATSAESHATPPDDRVVVPESRTDNALRRLNEMCTVLDRLESELTKLLYEPVAAGSPAAPTGPQPQTADSLSGPAAESGDS